MLQRYLMRPQKKITIAIVIKSAIMLLNRLLNRANVPFRPDAALALAASARNGRARRQRARAAGAMMRRRIEYKITVNEAKYANRIGWTGKSNCFGTKVWIMRTRGNQAGGEN